MAVVKSKKATSNIFFGCKYGGGARKGFFTSLLKKKPKSLSTGDSNHAKILDGLLCVELPI